VSLREIFLLGAFILLIPAGMAAFLAFALSRPLSEEEGIGTFRVWAGSASVIFGGIFLLLVFFAISTPAVKSGHADYLVVEHVLRVLYFYPDQDLSEQEIDRLFAPGLIEWQGNQDEYHITNTRTGFALGPVQRYDLEHYPNLGIVVDRLNMLKFIVKDDLIIDFGRIEEGEFDILRKAEDPKEGRGYP
jgi:hypothetical protein